MADPAGGVEAPHPDQLPSSLAATLRRAEVDLSQLHIVARSDLDATGSFGGMWLVIAGGAILILDEAGRIERRLALDDVDELVAESMVGGGMLTAESVGDRILLIRHSSACAAKFGYIARWMNDWFAWQRGKRDDPPIWDFKDPTRFCPSCGLPLEDEYSPCPACSRKSRALRRIFSYLGPYKRSVTVLILLVTASTAMQIVGPYFTRVIVDDVLQPTPEPSPLLGEWVRSMPSTTHALLGAVALMAGLFIVGHGLQIIHGRLHAWLGLRLATDIRHQLYQRLHELSLRFFDKRQTGTVISQVTHDTDRIYFFLVDGVPRLVQDLLIVVGIFIVLMLMNWKLTLALMFPIPLVLIGATWFWRTIRSMFHRAWSRHSKLHDVVNNAVSGVRVVRAFSQERAEVGRFDEANEGYREHATRAEVRWATFFPILVGSVEASRLVVWLVGGLLVLRYMQDPGAGMSLGTLLVFIGYLWMFFMPLMHVGPLLNFASRCLTAAERIFEVIDSEVEQPESERLVAAKELRGEVAFRRLTFGYEPHKPVLREIDLHVAPGEMIGLVGHSGAGKSTMINLLCRFYEADEGGLYIDGVNINELRLAELRQQIGVVLQEPFLFDGTIAENIAFARPEAEMPQIVAAAQAANAHEFIVKMPDGYDTEVGERGSRLSGGERQRISIARAILHNPRILILDEATSSVDVQTEKKIQEAIQRLIAHRTTFAIAHRLSTLRHADRLFVLKDGRGVECGTHEELMAGKGEYFKLVETQRQVSEVRSETEVVAG